ncbi:hypothetical protein G7Y89_g9900 [Cudoniella acicularis]|uniref:Ecp2 effector protein domain-containing protein n=1 Tax=Cudoniella acicularis TaxID=354080 RepID=A0A8H4RGJ4_9HELO|nr:hypothetical protein G7Y89_g9900 [Cudoniella acicularis]
MTNFYLCIILLAAAIYASPLPSSRTRTISARSPGATSQTFVPFSVPAEGVLNCKPEHDAGDTNYYFNGPGALLVISNFCQSLVADKIIMGKGGTAYQDSLGYTDGKGQGLDLTVVWTMGGDCPSVDFSGEGMLETCETNFKKTIDECDTTTSGGWKQGGGFTQGCIIWAVGRLGQP